MSQPPARVRNFAETMAARAQNDPAFARALLEETMNLLLNREPESAKLILRDLVNATVGFEALADEIHKPAKSLHRMLSKSGNPTMRNVSAIFAAIKRTLKVEVRAQVVMA
jgi:DNA-binding phage protein